MTTGSVRGKCVVVAGLAVPSPARRRDFIQRAAVGAEAAVRVPVHERLGRGQHRRLLARNQVADRDRSEVDELEVVASRRDQDPPVEEAVARVRAQLDRLVGQEGGEDWRAARREAQQRLDLRAPKRFDLADRRERIEPGLANAQHGHVAGDQERPSVVAGAQAGDLGRILASIGRAVEPIDGKAEAFEMSQA